MNEDYVSYELAEKLKAAGFDEPCDHYYAYDEESKIKHLLISASPSEWDWNYAELPEFVHPECSAPLLFHAQKWLRERKNWHIIIEPYIWESLTYEFKLWHRFRGYENADKGFYFSSYERALSAGISAALGLIKKGE